MRKISLLGIKNIGPRPLGPGAHPPGSASVWVICYECFLIWVICTECFLTWVICTECFLTWVICTGCLLIWVICTECFLTWVICSGCFHKWVICFQKIEADEVQYIKQFSWCKIAAIGWNLAAFTLLFAIV